MFPMPNSTGFRWSPKEFPKDPWADLLERGDHTAEPSRCTKPACTHPRWSPRPALGGGVVSLRYPGACDPDSQEPTTSRASLCCGVLLGEGSSPPTIWRGVPTSFLRFPREARRRVAAPPHSRSAAGFSAALPWCSHPALISPGGLSPPTLRPFRPRSQPSALTASRR